MYTPVRQDTKERAAVLALPYGCDFRTAYKLNMCKQSQNEWRRGVDHAHGRMADCQEHRRVDIGQYYNVSALVK